MDGIDVYKRQQVKVKKSAVRQLFLLQVLTQDRLDVKTRKNSSVEVFLTVLHAMLTSSKTLKFS